MWYILMYSFVFYFLHFSSWTFLLTIRLIKITGYVVRGFDRIVTLAIPYQRKTWCAFFPFMMRRTVFFTVYLWVLLFEVFFVFGQVFILVVEGNSLTHCRSSLSPLPLSCWALNGCGNFLLRLMLTLSSRLSCRSVTVSGCTLITL